MSKQLIGLFTIFIIIIENASSDPCAAGQTCVPYSSCNFPKDDNLIYPCPGRRFCCPNHRIINMTKNLTPSPRHPINKLITRTNSFPEDCGLINADDKVIGGKMADLGQFPWMARLGYRQRTVPITEYLCGGSLISSTYVLSAAHCIVLLRPRELVTVRLGEHNVSSPIDCVDLGISKECADKPIDVRVLKVVIHKDFETVSLKNDIALIKIQPVKPTAYVRPVCLPFSMLLNKEDFVDRNFTISGWGTTNAVDFLGSVVLQFAQVAIWDWTRCNEKMPPVVKPIEEYQMCANGRNNEDACRGDSGGPMVNATKSKDLEVRYIQVGIVSFYPLQTCGDAAIPTIYTRVDQYLSWIVENIS